MIKKLAFLFCLLFAFFPLRVNAYDFEVDGVAYNMLDDGSLEVGSGGDYLGSVVIPVSVVYEGETYYVTAIGEFAFAYNSSLTSVVIPNSVTTIGNYAFYGCTAISTIKIPGSVVSIGEYAFYSCKSLTSIEIPFSVNSIGICAFSCCANLQSFNGKFSSQDRRCLIVDGALNSFAPAGLTSYSIPKSVTSIGDYAFYGCKSLRSIEIPNSVVSVGICAFSYCSSLESFRGKFASQDQRCLIVDGVLNSFAPAHLTEYAIPSSVTSIGYYAFYSCSDLTSIVIPNSVTSIGVCAIYRCSSLTSIEIPNSVTSIGNYAFSGCSALTSVDIPDSVTAIGYYAFYCCSSLISVNIPASVTSIGFGCFLRCEKLDMVTANNPDPSNIEMGANVFDGVPTSICRLFVPTGSVRLYREADQWKDFKHVSVIPDGSVSTECATPLISILDNQLVVTCETDGAEIFVSLISNDQVIEQSFLTDAVMTLTGQYLVTAYATCGTAKSETAQAIIAWAKSAETTGEIDVIETGTARALLVKISGDYIQILGTMAGEEVEVYDLSGILLYSGKTAEETTIIPVALMPGQVYLIRIAGQAIKCAFY